GAVLARLRETGALLGSRQTRQAVGVHERCLTPVEFQIRPQWFIAVRDRRDRLRARADELEWIPPFMKRRLEDWIDGLRWDWNITRQRHYGVPFPVWFCRGCDRPVLAGLDRLPVDPLSDPPPVTACPDCGSGDFAGDPDVMDTWMTSSLSPQINDGWALHGLRPDPAVAPMSLRVQAFEIIRTWLFYSLVQADYHFGRIPWRAAMISGWGLNEQGRKISKRDLDQTEGAYNRYVPDDVIDRYGADALRLWATRARVGADLRYTEKDVRVGRKFAVKLWNVARFIELNSTGFDPSGEPPPAAARTPVDRWLLSHLANTVAEVTAAFDGYDVTQAYAAASRFFWSTYCDRYIEMVKERFLVPEAHPDSDRDSAQWTLWQSFRVLLGLFAPFAPFVTEHLYQRRYAPAERAVSLHLTRWPGVDRDWLAGERDAIDQMTTVLDAVRTLRGHHQLGNSARVRRLILDPGTGTARALAEAIAEPLRSAARAHRVVYGSAAHPSGVPDLGVDIAV
ncbi:MAG TPA: class I tRNA ligase family protein, partial [Rugosimonospora sp.]|nr:class I tRNA ligase family protein [Rugosimonospora sp.]